MCWSFLVFWFNQVWLFSKLTFNREVYSTNTLMLPEIWVCFRIWRNYNTYVYAHVYIMCMWWVWVCLPYLLSTLYFETRSWAEPGAYWFIWTGWLANPRYPSVSTPSVNCEPLGVTFVWALATKVFKLVQQALCWQSKPRWVLRYFTPLWPGCDLRFRVPLAFINSLPVPCHPQGNYPSDFDHKQLVLRILSLDINEITHLVLCIWLLPVNTSSLAHLCCVLG